VLRPYIYYQVSWVHPLYCETIIRLGSKCTRFSKGTVLLVHCSCHRADKRGLP